MADRESLSEARHRVQEYLRRIAEGKRDEGLDDDMDDRVGARHRVELEIAWLGRYVYENAHTLGMWDDASPRAALRPMSPDGLAKLDEPTLRRRIALAFERMGDFQRGTSRGYRRAESIRDEGWAELDRRGLRRV